MKSVFLPLVLLATAFSTLVGLANATPVTARYFRFEGYSTTGVGLTAGRIRLYEIEVFANGVNVARNATVTANSVTSGLSLLNDGSLSAGIFSSSNTNPGPPSEASPHWIQMDFGSTVPIDKTNIYVVGSDLISFGLFLSNDGVSWTQFGRYNQAGGTIQSDPSAPVVVIQSAAMRPGTTLMDVVYRVNDPNDATVKTRALAFVDGVRSFANVLKPVTFVEGTAAKLGDAIPTNVDHTLTWDVGADWDIDLGQIKFEVLAMDGRGLLPIDWIRIPAAGGNPALTISKDTPSDSSILSGLFWQYASGDAELSLTDGKLRGNSASGNFAGVNLATDAIPNAYSAPFLFKRMNLDPSLSADVGFASGTARAGLLNTEKWHATNRPYNGIPIVQVWGDENFAPPSGLSDVTAISAGYNSCLAIVGGKVVSWGYGSSYQVLPGLSDVTAISAGNGFNLALKSDGKVVAWGSDQSGLTNVPPGLSGVTAIAAGGFEPLALKNDGTVVTWGDPNVVMPVPEGLNGVTAIAASNAGRLALKSDQTVVAWGGYEVPEGLSGVIAISAGADHILALKSDGTVVAWGADWANQINVPAGLSGVTAISAGSGTSVALKNDGTVVAWGYNTNGQTTVPTDLSGVTAISAGNVHVIALKSEKP
jgi:hypothetical protein